MIPLKNRRPGLRVLHTVAAHTRNRPNDLILGMVLAFVAGGINAGGFLAVGQYTSHMTGIVSTVADNVALGLFGLVGAALVALVAFASGAGASAILINWGRRNARRKQYAYPLAVEAVLLLSFGALGTAMQAVPGTAIAAVPLLCFIMGLQNATITKISGARIRTTHLTGMITDIGIELGKFVYETASRPHRVTVRADRRKLRILLQVAGMFFLGGVVGALGFKHLGYGFSIPLATLLLVLTSPQLILHPLGKRR